MATASAAAAADPRATVLVLLGAAGPRAASSGAVQSFRGMARALGGEFRFQLVAADRASGRPPARDAISAQREDHEADYRRIGWLGARGLRRVLAAPHDLLLLNGFFARDFTLPALMLRRSGLAPRRPTILTPHGEFASGALALKRRRKCAYAAVARRAGLLGDVWLHATSSAELDEIRRGFPWAGGYVTAHPIGAAAPQTARRAEPAFEEPLRIAFLGRITPVKNLDFALRALHSVRAAVRFDVHGPIEDAAHWRECRRLIETLPAHIEVRHLGELDHERVADTLGGYDLLFLPSLSENFGHAILEALSVGTPVLIGDRTPWKGLDSNEAGWDLPLDLPSAFSAVIDRLAAMPPSARDRLRQGARRLADRHFAQSQAVAETRSMLRAAIERGTAGPPPG